MVDLGWTLDENSEGCGNNPVAPLMTGLVDVNGKELGLLEESAVPPSSKFSAPSSPSWSNRVLNSLVPCCWSVVLGWLVPSATRTCVIPLSCMLESMGGNIGRGIEGSGGEFLEELMASMGTPVIFCGDNDDCF